ncbi:tetratricopeptide repeat protein [Opitutus terrae]|uniref:TPR repeat-containing protein n=1 Tax=Opitutus terrae (strain DSM 11246 / JCM 15787 / PB90-1) TaxID=452637 RepID=B1ZRE8_OPITP|nr:tetratricopeptide repeat protein [Opitutus terrae]ACB74635.1 TPR repeat-containing protein [Opitutus terrae PB90-1]
MPDARSSAPPLPARRGGARRWLGFGAALLALVAFVYAPTLSAPFHLDDAESIVGNATLRDFWSFAWAKPPATGGETVSGRPVLNFTFALNQAWGGLDVRGYHVVNVLIHALAALVLFGVVRRGLALARGRAAKSAVAPVSATTLAGECSYYEHWRESGIAFFVAALWAVHPLQTSAVSYVAQRAESLAGLFYLLVLYGFIRGAEAAGSGGGAVVQVHRRDARAPATGARWFTFSVAACLLGVGTKETIVTAPLVVLLADRAFVTGGFAAAWRARRRYYLALAATWLVLGALVVANRGRGGSAGFGASITSWEYLVTQAGAVGHYLQLVFWPTGQVFDYGVALAPLAAVWPQALLLLGLAGVGFWLLARNQAGGFLIASFFLLLAPSSSLVPIATQTVAEHRMYLASAVVIAAVAFGCWRAMQRLASSRTGAWVTSAALGAAVLALGVAAHGRNQLYRSELALWQDTVAKRPDNPRAHHNFGLALAAAGRSDEAMAEFRRAIALQPNHVFAHTQLALALLDRGEPEAASAHFRAALAADPSYAAARVNLGRALARLGRTDEAATEYEAVLRAEPGAVDAGTNLAALLLARGETERAAALLAAATAAAPALAEPHYHYGLALEQLGRIAEAESALRQATELKPDWAEPWLALGNVLARRGEAEPAERAYRSALHLAPRTAAAHYGLGNLLAQRRNFRAAMEEFQAVLAIDPAHVPARNNLGNCQLVTGQLREAVATYEEVLRARPNDAAVERNLALARELLRSGGHGP